MNYEDDLNLVQKAKINKEDFGLLYNKYYKPILSYIYRKTSDQATSEDLASDVFRKAFEAIDSYKWQGISFASWLYRIARNRVIDFYRSDKSSKNVKIDDSLEEPKDLNTPEVQAIEFEFGEKIRLILKELPGRERKIIYMKFFEGYTNRTISKVTGISETNVGTILYRSLRKLRDNM